MDRRRVTQDDDEQDHRRRQQSGPMASSQSASGGRRAASTSDQYGRPLRDPRVEANVANMARLSISSSTSQQSAMTASSSSASGSVFPRSAMTLTPRTSISSSQQSDYDDDEEDDDDDEEDDDDRYEQATTSRHRQSNSRIKRSEVAPMSTVQQRAQDTVQRLMNQGYTQSQAITTVRKAWQENAGGKQRIKDDDDEDDDTDEDNESDEDYTTRPTERNAPSAQLPGPFGGRMAWKGQDLQRGCELITLGSSDIEAVQSAVARYKATRGAIGDITRETFRISPKLESKLRDASEEIHGGRGFVTLRGLYKAGFSDEDSTIAFVGIAAHVCPEKAVSRLSGLNLAMDHIYDARDIPAQENAPELPPTKLPTMLHFHCDRFNGDVLAMYVRHPGVDGEGQQYVASFTTIYNQLLLSSPQTLLVLGKEDWPFVIKHNLNQAQQTLPGPVIFFNGSNIPICQLVLEPLFGEPLVPRSNKAPPLSTAHQEAVKVVQQLAAQHQYKLERQKGDIQFINNLGILHARSQYNQRGPSGRHLLRMFLRDPKYAWPKPANWKAYFDSPFQGSSSGAMIDHRDKHPRIAVFLHG